jgi:Transposase DDE domain
MHHDSKFKAFLTHHLDRQAQRITGLTLFAMAVIKTRHMDTKQLSLAMNSQVTDESNQKRLQRLLDEIILTPKEQQALLLNHQHAVRISLDRTQWNFGNLTNNLLTAAVETHDFAVPITCHDLGVKGCSNDDERIEAINQVLKIIPAKRIEVLTADREFASQRLIAHLIKCKLAFSLRLKSDAIIEHGQARRAAADWFTTHRRKRLRAAVVYGSQVHVCGRRWRNHRGQADYLIVVTNLEPDVGFDVYKTRWRIETLFAALKSRGFNLEATRVVQSARLENLVLLLGLVLLLALRVGVWVKSNLGCRSRADGVPLYSVFRLGLDFLRRLLLDSRPQKVRWRRVEQALWSG